MGATPFTGATLLETVNYNAREAASVVPFPTTVKYFNIGPDVLSIPTAIFADNNTVLENLVIPANVKTIASGAFTMTGFTKPVVLTLEANLLSEGAFSGSVPIRFVIIGSGVTMIPKETFKNVKVGRVELGNVTRIGNGAFDGSDINGLVIPMSVQTIEALAFANSANLQSVRFERSLVYIENTNAFPAGGSTVVLKTLYDQDVPNGGVGEYTSGTGWGWRKE
jgi:hypothetical protein